MTQKNCKKCNFILNYSFLNITNSRQTLLPKSQKLTMKISVVRLKKLHGTS